MPDKPETLEETQARLARVQQGDALPPAVSVPIPSVSGPPGSPYGPGAPGVANPAEIGGTTPFGTAAQRPDPYAVDSFAPAQLQPVHPPALVGSNRPIKVAAIVAGAVGLVVVAGVVAYNVFSYDTPTFPTTDEPEYSEEWQEFPGVSYADPSETLAQPSYEEVVAGIDTLLTQYRDELTAKYGFTWSQQYEGYSDLAGNGYGGDSMLYYVDTGTWQGQVQLNDPTARQGAFDIFSQLAASNGGDGVLLRNELYADDAELSRSEFGADQLADQALWSFFDSFPALADGYLSSDVFDRSIPVDDTFTGDYMFTYDESSDTLYVTVYGYADALLKEGDRDAFEAALEPYNGDYEP